ncbi:MAG: hypothetical protein DME26_09710 [Verrucomicrobia bacterium]|nr:MAG: hypothetical protein DME26_09710 [Verrucomicrobiota bacterium]
MVTLTAAPPNDDFDRRKTLRTSQNPSTYTVGTTYGATHEPGEPDHGNGPNSASAWWTWTAPSNGLYAIYDGSAAQLERIYTGDTLTRLETVGTIDMPQAQGLPRTEFRATADTNYQIAVDTAAGGGFGFGLAVYPVPVNDHFLNRLALDGASNVVHASVANASHEPGEPRPFRGDSVWWSWVSSGAGSAIIAAGNATTWVDVFTNRNPGSLVVLSNLALVQTAYISSTQSAFATRPNLTYYLAGGTTDWSHPVVNFTLSFGPEPQLTGQWHPPEFQWQNSAVNPWFRQTNTVFNGSDAAQSGYLAGWAPSLMSVTSTRPGALSFWWKVSAPESIETISRSLYFSPGVGLDVGLIGPRDWTRYTTWIGPGTNFVSWAFYGSRGGTAWVDRVEFVPGVPGSAVLTMMPVQPWGSASLRVNGVSGRAYQIQVSSNLVDWIEWMNVIGIGTWPYVNFSVTTNQPARFFRAITQ